MRQIKFRVFDKHQNRMITNDVNSYVSFLSNGEVNYESLFDTTILMQYTGVLDKNNIEAYIGDIAKDKHGSIFEIIEFYYFLSYLETIEFEIIGNKYENKDLLND